MQRKSGILKQRNGFAMIMAIFFMIIIATLLTYMLATTTETAQRTTNTYINEQAQLLAKSATEYAILRVSGFDRSGADGILGTADDTCMQGFNSQYPETGANAIFDINVTINYFGFGNGCAPLFVAPNAIGDIQTEESNGTMMIDIYVSDNAALNFSEPIRYHRRTLQKL